MGAQFDLSHINLVGYLTDETGLTAPRSDIDTIGKFLMSLAYGGNLISSTQGSPDDWTRQVAAAAEDQFHRLNFQFNEPANKEPVGMGVALPFKTSRLTFAFYSKQASVRLSQDPFQEILEENFVNQRASRSTGEVLA